MRRLVSLAFVIVLASGCALTTQRVNVPVPVPCTVETPAKPALPVDALPDDADIFIYTRALWATLLMQEAYEKQLEAALEACR